MDNLETHLNIALSKQDLVGCSRSGWLLLDTPSLPAYRTVSLCRLSISVILLKRPPLHETYPPLVGPYHTRPYRPFCTFGRAAKRATHYLGNLREPSSLSYSTHHSLTTASGQRTRLLHTAIVTPSYCERFSSPQLHRLHDRGSVLGMSLRSRAQRQVGLYGNSQKDG